jgi:hypothetical protein
VSMRCCGGVAEMWKMMRLRDGHDTDETSNVIAQTRVQRFFKAEGYSCATTFANTREKRHASFTKKQDPNPTVRIAKMGKRAGWAV